MQIECGPFNSKVPNYGKRVNQKLLNKNVCEKDPFDHRGGVGNGNVPMWEEEKTMYCQNR